MASTILAPVVAFKTLGLVYVAFAFFNLFAAALIVERIGCRAALFAASLTYATYAVANVVALHYPDNQDRQLSVLLPSGVLAGLGASVIWAAQGVYVTRCAKPENTGKYTGVFFGIFWWASILGPLLTGALLKAEFEKILVFKVLAAVGFIGPIVFLYLWIFRPEPSNPDIDAQHLLSQLTSTMETTPTQYKFLKTFRIMFTRSMFFLAPLYYMTSVEQAFSGGSLPLFIKSESPKTDLENKLMLQATFGTTLMITSFIIGGITDRFGSRPLLVIDLFLHIGAMSLLWLLNPINNYTVLFPCAIILAFSDSLLMNQIYKLLGTLYPNKSDVLSAFAAYKFHQSLCTGLVFLGSKLMLGENGVPNMNLWLPLVTIVLGAAVIGVFIATQGILRSGEAVVGRADESTPLLQGDSYANEVAQELSEEEVIEYKRQNNRLGDVIVLSVAFFFIFSAFMVIQGLATSVLPKSVAFFSLGSLYFSFSFCNLFLAAPVVELLGCRAGMFAASITYSLFNLATIIALQTDDGVAQTAILFPAALLNGFGASVLWTAESVYITKCSCKDSVGRYAGYFFAFVSSANLAGPLFSSFLLQLEIRQITVFKILLGVGALGPLLTLYIMYRPAPANPYDAPATASETTAAATPVSTASLIFKTFNTMISSTILLIAPLSYYGSSQMAFNGGSIPLLINTGDTNADLATKLYLVAVTGATSTVSSAIVGPYTDRYGPRVMLCIAIVAHTTTISTIVANQGYKIMGVLFKGTASAFAAQRFHGSLATGVAFMSSGLMLRESVEDGRVVTIPDLNKWAPLITGLLWIGTVGAFAVTKDERFQRRF
ncbi:DUF895 domain membrane protein [Physocladia obscura]|uniref:UNC93-like protein MFSD11 n=1 Tax=Physocladia obscura TaxID=109957 RepID=A0AAD5XHH5_9FUNG|nr:DUF895 domain membrane protein [Physocladia obscura]